MSVPNESAFVNSFIGQRLKRLGSLEETRANTFEAVNAGCADRHAKDRRWGLLEKTGGDRVRDRAADIWAYDLGDGTAQLVDVVNNAEGDGGSPSPSWGIVPVDRAGIRPISQWRVPFDVVTPPTDPDEPDKPPTPVIDLSEVLKKLDAISADIARLKTLTEAVSQDTELTHDIVTSIRDKPQTPVSVQFPAYVGALGYRLRLTPEEKK